MKEHILNKARDYFFLYGLKSVSMDDISKVLGISKKTIYQVYKDKEAIVEAVVEDLMKKHKTLLEKAQNEGKNPIAEVLEESDRLFSFWASINPVFFYDLAKWVPNSWQKMERYQQQVILPSLVQNLERGIKESLYRNDLDVIFTAEIRLQQMISALQTNIGNSGKSDISSVFKKLTMFYLHGITSKKGKELLEKYLALIPGNK